MNAETGSLRDYSAAASLSELRASIERLWRTVKAWVLRRSNRAPVSASVRTVSKKKKKADGAPASRHASIKSTLENLSHDFLVLKKVDCRRSPTDRGVRRALRAMGPHNIPAGWGIRDDGRITIFDGITWPSLVFTSLGEQSDDKPDADIIKVRFFYANKLERAPWICNQLRGFNGAIYECGVAVVLDGQVGWAGFHVGINSQTGEITPAKQIEYRQHRLPNGSAYTQMTVGYPTVFSDSRIDQLRLAVQGAFEFWNTREGMWRVSCRKDGARMTFCVPPKETKNYFEDRGVTALAADGKKKRIIHHVRTHHRVLQDHVVSVKEHIRGIRAFNWNGYECKVIAPTFHRFIADDFTAPGIFVEDQEKGTKYMSLEKGASLLAQAEDMQHDPRTHEAA